jgi:hypothetical protein
MPFGTRARSVTVAAALVFAASAAGLVASSQEAAAAQPIVVGSCATTIQGEPGTPLALSPAAVLTPVLNVVRAVPLVGPGLVSGVTQQVNAMGNIPLGALPGADTTVSGAQISAVSLPYIQQAISKVPLIGPVLGQIVTGVQGALTAGCGLVVDVTNAAGGAVQDGTGVLADTSQQVFGPGPGSPAPGSPPPNQSPPPQQTPNQPVQGGMPGLDLTLYPNGLWDFGRAPMADYSSIPFAVPGMYAPSPGVRYGGSVPGYSPEFGILGGAESQADQVQQAGRAEAMTPPAGRKVAVPVLVAVLALSCVTAALVRTWVLRRAGASARA